MIIYIHIDICIIFIFINNAHPVCWLNVVSTLAFTCVEMLPLLVKHYQIKAFLCWTLMVFEQEGIFFLPHLLWHRTSVLGGLVQRKLPHLVISHDWQRILRIASDPDSPPIQNIKDQVFKLLTKTIRSLIFIL